MTQAYEVPSSNRLNEVRVRAKNYIRFSNNISAINVVSTLQDNLIDKSQLTKFTVGSNIKNIMPSCFIDCQNLSSVQFNGQMQTIGRYAFYNCSSLKAVNALSTGNIARDIGTRAFARSGIEHVKFGMKNNTSEELQSGDEIFASCYSLRDVSFKDRNTVVDRMFAECTALTSVSFADSTSILGESAFENCTSLASLRMPADAYSVPSQFAKGCTSLQRFEFAEPGQLTYSQSLGDQILEGTNLTSITFPRSLSSLNAFSNYTLQGMPFLKEIHFNGMTYNQLATESQQQQQQQPEEPSQPDTLKYSMNKVYYQSSLDRVIDTYNIDRSVFVNKSVGELTSIINYCIEQNIPIVAFYSGDDYLPSGVLACANCRSLAQNVLASQSFVDYMRNNNKCIIIYGHSCCTNNVGKSSLRQRIGGNISMFAGFIGYWNEKNGDIHKFCKDHVGPSNSSWVESMLMPEINKLTNGYIPPESSSSSQQSSQPSQTSYTANATITSTNCFGLNHNVKLFSNDGKFVEFNSGPGGGTVLYSYNVQVDRITSNDFRYGQWYEKVQALKQYADTNYIPVLAVATQTDNYKESKLFNQDVFNSQMFQDYITSKSILLCKVSSSSFSGGDASFLLRNWMMKSSFSRLPLLMMYWMKKDGSVLIQDPDIGEDQAMQSYDYAIDDFAYFSSKMSDGKIDDAECVHSTSDVITWIDNLTAYNEYVPNNRFKRPEIQSLMTRYPRYKMYANQLDDNYGRYFPVRRLANASNDSFSVNVNDGAGKATQYILKYGTQPGMLPPKGTYQYFSMLSDNMDIGQYESSYQLSGLMFKIGGNAESQLIRHDSYAYSAKTEAAYLAGINVNASMIDSITSSFYRSLYETGEDGYPTTTIDPEEAEGLPFLWNVNKTLMLKYGTKLESKDAVAVQLWLSSAAQIQVEHIIDDDGDEYDVKTLIPSEPQYVISADVIGNDIGPASLLWIKEFYNN